MFNYILHSSLDYNKDPLQLYFTFLPIYVILLTGSRKCPCANEHRSIHTKWITNYFTD